MGKVGTGFSIDFQETRETDKLSYAGNQSVKYSVTIPHDGVVLIAASTATTTPGTGTGIAGTWVEINGATVAWDKSIIWEKSGGDNGGGSSVSANLAVKKGDNLAISIRNTMENSDAYLTVLSTAGKLEFTKSH